MKLRMLSSYVVPLLLMCLMVTVLITRPEQAKESPPAAIVASVAQLTSANRQPISLKTSFEVADRVIDSNKFLALHSRRPLNVFFPASYAPPQSIKSAPYPAQNNFVQRE